MFLRWSIWAAIIGSLCGLVGALFHIAVDEAAALRETHDWLIFLLPLAGILLVAAYRFSGIKHDKGTNLVLRSIQSGERIPLRIVPLIFLGTVLTHLCGGSSGREGAALQIGSGLAVMLSKILCKSEEDIPVFTMCGMSALFSAVFGTPVTAAIFSMEVVTVGVIRYSAFFPCIFSGFVAWEVASCFGLHPTAFALPVHPELSASLVMHTAALTLLCVLCAIFFLQTMHAAEHLYRKYLPNAYLRVFVGACLVVLATMALGTRDYNGAGMDVIARAVSGESETFAFLFKIILTALTLGAGFKGGEIIPTFFIGATFGCTVGPLLGLDPGLSAAIGIIALFCSVVNCPLASLLMSVELFGSEHLLLFALVSGLSYSMSGYRSLYSSQRIIYSKLIHKDDKKRIE